MSTLGWALWLLAGVVLEGASVIYRKKTLSQFTWQKTRNRAVYFGFATLLVWAFLHLLQLGGFENIP